jgi:hypothetical protein
MFLWVADGTVFFICGQTIVPDVCYGYAKFKKNYIAFFDKVDFEASTHANIARYTIW